MKFLRFAPLLIALGIPLLVSACGGGGGSSLAKSDGAKVFTGHGCNQCHTLSAVKATGQVGPNLDLLKPDAVTVAHQVRVGGNGMPSFANQLSKTQIRQVAVFVAAAARAAGKVQAFKPDKTTLADCADKSGFGCYRQAFGNLVFKDGPDEGAERRWRRTAPRSPRSAPTATRSSTRSDTRRSPTTTTTPARRSPTAR